jgi:putative SOS response-associated peptidase YedK
MCGRYSLGDPSPLMRRFGLEEFAETTITPRFNVAPTQEIPIVVERPTGRELRIVKWGFVPFFMRDSKSKRPPPINAKAETLSTSGMFRGSVAKWRCIIPADGFYEWQTIPGEKTRQPMYIQLAGRGIFGFAGLYTSKSDASPGTAVIITTTPNELVAPIHNRMPAILLPALEAMWLDPNLTDVDEALSLLTPYPADAMIMMPVSTQVNTATAEGPELIVPIRRS